MTVSTPTSTATKPFSDAFLASSPVRRFFFTRGVPILIAGVLTLIVLFSRVGVNLWIIKEPLSSLVVAAYIGMLIHAAYDPLKASIHRWGSAFAVLVFGGRAGGFIDIIIRSYYEPDPELGFREDLSGAVSERILIMALVVIWHTWMMWRATAIQLTEKALIDAAINPPASS